MSQSPRYDSRIRRRGGYQWASETDLEGLEFWLGRAKQPASNPAYQSKNEAEAKKLSYWVSWRRESPDERWQGVRGDEAITAAAPGKHPTRHSWEPRGEAEVAPVGGYPKDESEPWA